MVYFDIIDSIYIFGIFILLTMMSFSFYLPLRQLIKDSDIVLALVIPISLSMIISIGYIFYLTPFINFFPLFLIVFLIILNSLFFIKHDNIKFTITSKAVFPSLFVLIPVIFTRYYDSIVNIIPGNNDTFNHIYFLLDLDRIGYISSSYYAPALQLIFYPIFKLLPISEIYRFGGPTLGIITLLSLFLILRNVVKHQLSLIFFILLSCLPIFNQFTLQSISFFTSALSFIFFVTIIYILGMDKLINAKLRLFLLLIINIAIALSVPYLFVQLIPAQFILLCLIIVYKRKFSSEYIKIISYCLALCILGFAFAFFHIVLQTKLLGRGTQGSFPMIPITTNSDGRLVITDNFNFKENNYNIKKILSANPFASRYLLPMYNTGYELQKIKNIRKPDNIVAIGSYIWIILSIPLIFFSLRIKNNYLFIISIFSIFFGILTQTGLLEMSIYRGRVGWYLLLLCLLGSTIVFDELIKNRTIQYLKLICIILLPLSFFDPPKFYRPHYTDSYDFAYYLNQNIEKNKKVYFIARDQQLALLSDRFIIKPLELNSFQTLTKQSNVYLIIEKFYKIADPVLSQRAYSNDKNYKEYFIAQEKETAMFNEYNELILNSEEIRSYQLIKETDTLKIYQRKDVNEISIINSNTNL